MTIGLLSARLNMSDEARIDFDSPAALKKSPSLNNQPVNSSVGVRLYSVLDGTLDECIRKFIALPVGQQHLYLIHTFPQPPLVAAVLTTELIVEIARLRDFL